MKKYTVIASYETELQAESEDEAYKILEDAIDDDLWGSDFQIDVYELEED